MIYPLKLDKDLEKGLTIYRFVEPTEYNCTNMDDHARIGKSNFSFKISPLDGDHIKVR